MIMSLVQPAPEKVSRRLSEGDRGQGEEGGGLSLGEAGRRVGVANPEGHWNHEFYLKDMTLVEGN